MRKRIFNSRTLYPYKRIFEKTPLLFKKAKPFVESAFSVSLFLIPFVFPSSKFLCFVSLILSRHDQSSGSILQSSFIFFDTQLNSEGNSVTVYNKRNILIASLGTAVLGSILVYFLYPRNPRPMIPVILPALPETKVIVPLLASKEDLLSLKTNCLHVNRMYELLTKFIINAEKGIVPPMEVQKNFLKWVYADKKGMQDFLVENKEWFIPFSLTDSSALTCLATMKKLDPLYKLTCETSIVLKAYCDFLAKN